MSMTLMSIGARDGRMASFVIGAALQDILSERSQEETRSTPQLEADRCGQPARPRHPAALRMVAGRPLRYRPGFLIPRTWRERMSSA